MHSVSWYSFNFYVNHHSSDIFSSLSWKTLPVANNCILDFVYKTADWSRVSQDGYVPYHSARIEMCPASSGDYSKKGKLFLEMLNDCLEQIRAPSSDHRIFMRCDVNFDISVQGRNINTIIGRAAHIEFLETDIFAKFIMWSFPDLFRWLCGPNAVISRGLGYQRARIQCHPTSDFFMRGAKNRRILGMALNSCHAVIDRAGTSNVN